MVSLYLSDNLEFASDMRADSLVPFRADLASCTSSVASNVTIQQATMHGNCEAGPGRSSLCAAGPAELYKASRTESIVTGLWTHT